MNSMTPQAMFDYLKASALARLGDEYDQGARLGRRWASQGAEHDELMRVGYVACEQDSPADWEAMWSIHPGPDGVGGADGFAWMVRPETHGDRAAAVAFWEQALGSDLEELALSEDSGFIRGFADGALEVCLGMWRENGGPV